jgi:hypothetical protein
MFASLSRFLNQVQSGISKILTIFFSLPRMLRDQYHQFCDHLKLIKHNLGNLRDANMNLAYHHMKMGNLKDVILRCLIITKFVNSKDEEAYNLMAVAYYLLGNIDKAKKNIILAGDFGNEDFKDFIEKPQEDIDSIPLEIFAQYRNYNISDYIEDKNGIYTTLSNKLVDELFEHIEEIDENCKILDINSTAGAVFEAIKTRIGQELNITSLESSEKMREYLKDFSYDKILDYQDLKQVSDKYDIAISVLGFEYLKNISAAISSLRSKMKTNSLLALSLRLSVGKESYLNKERNAFIYEQDFLVNELNLADFEIISIKEVVISANKYALIICSKK